MTLFFYNLALLAGLAASLPWWLWRLATTQKYREGLRGRLGRVPKRVAPISAPAPERPLIWLHAVSVGEVLAVTRLVKTLDSELPGYSVTISTTTRTGQALARERFGLNRVFYCPLDLPWAVRAYLDALRPHMLILAETEFWPNLLHGCFRRQIPVVVVNARISDRSWPRYQMLRRLWRPILGKLSSVLAQSQTDADRLLAIGCSPQSVSVAGNLKFDVRAAQESEATRILKAQTGGLRFVVAGSTLDGEESALLDAWPRLLASDPQLAMVLAPRHPERFAAVASMLEKAGRPWVKRSSIPSASIPVSGHDFSRAESAANANETGALAPVSTRLLKPGTIVLLDTIGELASVYSLASVAFVGGSMVPAGGHNPLEPAQFGVPIVMGPHYANFTAITDSLRDHEALRIATKEELAGALIELLRGSKAANAMGARAREVFERQAGATDRCVKTIRSIITFRRAEEMKQSGAGLEEILSFLRLEKFGKIDSIKAARVLYDLGLAAAKEMIDSSKTWEGRLLIDQEFHREMWDDLEKAAQEPGSGITRTDEGFVFDLKKLSDENKDD